MGILLWLLGSVVALLACRFIPLGRTAGRVPEVVCGLAFALGGGLVATRLDFGGWNEPDPRAALFCALTTLSGVALARAARALVARNMTTR
ncbi:MAG: hypothetical protein ACSLFQ_00175 [Thermoanaerobaculia bacterium]